MKKQTVFFFILLLAACRPGGDYPNRPIVLVCPWGHGGGTDRVARQLAAFLEEDLKVPVNVQNVTGGEGVSGHSHGASARPDGYTLTMMTVEINMLRWRGLTRISYQDFTPVACLNRDAAAVFVRADAPWKTLKELEGAVRAAPGRLKASGTAQGGIWHLALGGWLRSVGLKPSDVIWQSLPGAARSLAELLAGGVDIVSCSLPEAASLLGSRVRSLGVMAPERLPQFPDVPTFREQGLTWTVGAWRGVGLPKRTPPEVTRRVAEAVERVVKSEKFQTSMAGAGFNVSFELPADFEKSLERTDAQMRELLTTPDFRAMRQKNFGPMFFPAVLGLALVAVAAALYFTGGFRREATAPIGRAGAAWCAALVGWVAVYLLLADVLGFILTSALLLFPTLWRMGNRPWVAAAVTLVLVPATYELFAGRLRVALPLGLLGW